MDDQVKRYGIRDTTLRLTPVDRETLRNILDEVETYGKLDGVEGGRLFLKERFKDQVELVEIDDAEVQVNDRRKVKRYSLYLENEQRNEMVLVGKTEDLGEYEVAQLVKRVEQLTAMERVYRLELTARLDGGTEKAVYTAPRGERFNEKWWSFVENNAGSL